MNGIRYRKLALEDLLGNHATAIINYRAGQGLKKHQHLTARQLLGRGPAELKHPELPFAAEHASEIKAEVRSSIERRQALHAAARKRKMAAQKNKV